MGADGHIYIWNDKTVRKAFPDCDELFYRIPFHYSDQLDGKLYHHIYFGDNFIMTHWDDPSDWNLPHHPGWDGPARAWIPLLPEQKAENDAVITRLTEFCAWLYNNATHWEVWT